RGEPPFAPKSPRSLDPTPVAVAELGPAAVRRDRGRSAPDTRPALSLGQQKRSFLRVARREATQASSQAQTTLRHSPRQEVTTRSRRRRQSFAVASEGTVAARV